MRVVDDTIVAIATAQGRGALAIVRLSGPRAHEMARAVLRPWPAAPRQASLADVCEPDTGAIVDQVIAVVYDAPRSYTGEAMVELTGHGGPLSAAAIVQLLIRQGARPAEPGEFTRRAVLSGKLDLLQAEAIADVVDAQTEASRRAALVHLDGGLSRQITALRSRLLDLEALLAYDIDFPEEDDGPVAAERIAAAVRDAEHTMTRLLATSQIGEVIRAGALVVIAGPPNAGKSSLLNALLGYRRAIVSETPGTTRDAIEVVIETGRWPIRLVDTAGIRESEDVIEREGVEVSQAYIFGAHVALVCDDDVTRLPTSIKTVRALTSAPILALHTKCDLDSEETRHQTGPTHGESAEFVEAAQPDATVAGPVRVSAVTREGLPELVGALESVLENHYGSAVDPELPILVRTRHRAALETALRELRLFNESWRSGTLPVSVAAVHVRTSVDALESLIGAVDVEDVLSRVFSSFCIGK